MSLCCSSCIGDRWLRENSESSQNTESGVCPYCQRKNQLLIRVGDFINHFQLLVDIYIEDDGGKSLVALLKEDWAMFPKMSVTNAETLLSEILENDEIVSKKFVPPESFGNQQLNNWEQLKVELMHENRFFPNTKFDESRIKELLDQLLITPDKFKPEWFRARIQKDDKMFPICEMGAPPKRSISQGRANPAGIPYLYIASDPETAISEIRPHTGEFASVANFTCPAKLKFIDLRSPRESVSPLFLGDEDGIALLREDLDFLIRIGEELARPVLPHAANIDYIPSQYLCELIKNCNFHGVVYNSSVGNGFNLAIFNPESAFPGRVKRYRVKKVSVKIDKVE